MQCTEYDYTSYKPLKCNKIQYGDKRKLKLDNTPDTLWQRDNFIREIESIRNEIIHNGSWQQPQNAYIRLNKGKVIERYVLYPDMEDGHYAKYVNRYHFFSKETKINDILPQIHQTFFKRLSNTLDAIIASLN